MNMEAPAETPVFKIGDFVYLLEGTEGGSLKAGDMGIITAIDDANEMTGIKIIGQTDIYWLDLDPEVIAHVRVSTN